MFYKVLTLCGPGLRSLWVRRQSSELCEVTRRLLGPRVEARLLVDCAACSAPPALRTNAKGRALSSILTSALPVALTPDGRAGRVLDVRNRADMAYQRGPSG